MSATALGLAEKATDDDDEWINLAAATAQAAEALTDDDQAAVDDAVGEEGDDEEEGEAEPSEAVTRTRQLRRLPHHHPVPTREPP